MVCSLSLCLMYEKMKKKITRSAIISHMWKAKGNIGNKGNIVLIIIIKRIVLLKKNVKPCWYTCITVLPLRKTNRNKIEEEREIEEWELKEEMKDNEIVYIGYFCNKVGCSKIA